MRFLLDNWLAARHARALNEIVKPDHTFEHFQQKFFANTKDEDWVGALSGENNLVVISGNHRVSKSVHERRAWQESGLTIFFLSKDWMNIPPLQQHSKLALLVDGIIAHAERTRPGSGFTISPKGKIQRIYP